VRFDRGALLISTRIARIASARPTFALPAIWVAAFSSCDQVPTGK
jgi:hypothetical protein